MWLILNFVTVFVNSISLYSTATQNSGVGGWRWAIPPDARILRWGYQHVKPIFHQNAKYLASGTFASPNAKDSIFASPNAKNTNMLVSFALGDANSCVGHVHFIFCVYISLRWVANANPISSGI